MPWCAYGTYFSNQNNSYTTQFGCVFGYTSINLLIIQHKQTWLCTKIRVSFWLWHKYLWWCYMIRTCFFFILLTIISQIWLCRPLRIYFWKVSWSCSYQKPFLIQLSGRNIWPPYVYYFLFLYSDGARALKARAKPG